MNWVAFLAALIFIGYAVYTGQTEKRPRLTSLLVTILYLVVYAGGLLVEGNAASDEYERGYTTAVEDYDRCLKLKAEGDPFGLPPCSNKK